MVSRAAAASRVVRAACLIALCLGIGLLAGCPGGTQAESPVVIGLIAYQPEPVGADFGAQMVQAAKLAADEVNRNGGLVLRGARRHVKLAIEVGPATPEAAVAAAHPSDQSGERRRDRRAALEPRSASGRPTSPSNPACR